MNKKGIALILVFSIITVLLILGSVILYRSISERNIARRYLESTQAFWLAEAGVNKAVKELRSNYNITSISQTALGTGGYQVAIFPNDATRRTVTSTGYIPSSGPARVTRVIQAMVKQQIPSGFYDYAVYSAGEVDFNGNSYSVANNQPVPDNQAVLYADEFDVSHPENITGTTTQDASISPLALLNFQQLYNISQSQGNVYNTTRLNNVKKGTDSFPGDFWNVAPTDPNDPTTGTPNVVYVLSDLELNGSVGTIGGFYVVVGDVITNPSATYDASINGNGQINGAIYTRGEFEVNGGGGGLNVNGGVWAGQEIELNGNAHITYNWDYMEAISGLGINADVQLVGWEDTQNPYPLAP